MKEIKSKYCKSCDKTYFNPKKNFNKDKSRKDGLTFYCKECTKKDTAYYENMNKKPIIKKACEYSKCNKTFETRMYHKKYCCASHASLAYQERIGVDAVRFKTNFNRKFRRSKEVCANAKKAWTISEIEILIKKRQKGETFKTIGVLLGRSSDSCLNKYHKVKKMRNKVTFKEN